MSRRVDFHKVMRKGKLVVVAKQHKPEPVTAVPSTLGKRPNTFDPILSPRKASRLMQAGFGFDKAVDDSESDRGFDKKQFSSKTYGKVSYFTSITFLSPI